MKRTHVANYEHETKVKIHGHMSERDRESANQPHFGKINVSMYTNFAMKSMLDSYRCYVSYMS